MAGPVWVTSPSALADFGIAGLGVDKNKAKWNGEVTAKTHLNLGWLMVEKDGGDWQVPESLKNKLPKPASDRIVLIDDKLFSQVVNSNLEVRTSVAINPKTGAAEDGALFTYEAIPRATFLWLDAVCDDFRGAFPSMKQLEDWKERLDGDDEQSQKEIVKKLHLWKKDNGDSSLKEAIGKTLEWIKDDLNHYTLCTMPAPGTGWKNNLQSTEEDGPQNLLTSGLEWAEHLGIGGMGTRGFGRLRKINCMPLQSGNKSDPEAKHATQ
jgi:CRISPR-associated protein Cmr4